VEQLKISENAKTFAVKSIETLIQAESKIHGEPEDSVHFHEAASFDTVIDLLGTAIALDDLGVLMIGIPIAFISPTTGELREQPFIPLFYASIGGIIVVIIYSGYKGKKERQKANRERRRKSKK